MRTLTIYNAVEGTEHIWNPRGIDRGDVYPSRRVDRAERQCRKFYAELLRRMDERDGWAAARKNDEALYTAMNYPATPKPGMFVYMRW